MNAALLVRLRWVAVGGQLLTIAVVEFPLRIALPMGPLLAIIGLTAATNVVFHLWVRGYHVSEPDDGETSQLPLAFVMMLDLLLLTALLYFTGGPANPFAVFYLVNVALAALILSDFWSWTAAALACACFASLFVSHVELPALGQRVAIAGRQWPQAVTYGSLGLLVALAACAGVVVYFITRVTHALREREAQLRRAEQQRAHAERLEALATLAAGAGHELATPLSTIAVVVKELTRHLEGQPVPQSVRDDVALIRRELDQCRAILVRMAGSAGQTVAEEVVTLCLADLLDEILVGVHRRPRVNISVSDEDAERNVRLPLQAVAQALRGVVRNALDASPPDKRVKLSAVCQRDRLRLTIRDEGSGMPPHIQARALEPFFTTKQPGRGMGLGLFLTKNVVERLGGSLTIHSQANRGTTVAIELPRVVL